MFLWIGITRAGTIEIFLEVVAGHHPGFIAALCEDHPDLFTAARFPLHGKSGTGLGIAGTFIEIDDSVFNDLGDLFLVDMAAFHAAQGMTGVI